MPASIDELRLQVDNLRRELADARFRIEALKRRHNPARRGSHGALTAAAAAIILGFAFWASAAPSVVMVATAPFVVTDAHDKPIFVVKEGAEGGANPVISSRGAYVFNSSSQTVAAIQAIQGGGAVRAFDAADPNRRVSIGANQLSILDSKSLVLADRTGVEVYGPSGRVAGLEYEEDRGFVGVYDVATGNPIAWMKEGRTGTGQFVGADAVGYRGWFFLVGPGGGSSCAVRNRSLLFCLGPQVWLD